MTTSFAQPDTNRTPAVVIGNVDHSDVDHPECSVCGYEAVGFVSYETPGDHEQRDGFCDRHACEVMAAAVIAEPFTPPTVSFRDVDNFRPWGSAA